MAKRERSGELCIELFVVRKSTARNSGRLCGIGGSTSSLSRRRLLLLLFHCLWSCKSSLLARKCEEHRWKAVSSFKRWQCLGGSGIGATATTTTSTYKQVRIIRNL